MLRMKQHLDDKDPNANSGLYYCDFDSCIILDRTCDLVTPLLTPMTYEGLIDTHYGIQNNVTQIDASFTEPRTTTTASTTMRKKKVTLSSTDPLYAQLRDLHFTNVGPILSEAAKRLSTEYDGRNTSDTSELKEFVGKLGGLAVEHGALTLHTRVAEDLYARVGRAWRGVEWEREGVDGIILYCVNVALLLFYTWVVLLSRNMLPRCANPKELPTQPLSILKCIKSNQFITFFVLRAFILIQ